MAKLMQEEPILQVFSKTTPTSSSRGILQYECQFRRRGFFIEIPLKFQKVARKTVSEYRKKSHDMKKCTSNFKIGIPLSGKELHTGELKGVAQREKG
jgi:hypothetical protein